MKANTTNVKQIPTEEREIRSLYLDFLKNLPQSLLEDKKGYKLRRQPTTTELEQFNNSLPDHLKAYRQKQSEARRTQYIESELDYDPNTWDEEDEALQQLEPISEEREVYMTQDLLAHEGLNLDIVWIPEVVRDSLSETELEILENAPSYRQRERIWERQQRLSPSARRRRALRNARITKEDAVRIIEQAARQESQFKASYSRTQVTYIEIRQPYFEPRPGIWKGYAPKEQVKDEKHNT